MNTSFGGKENDLRIKLLNILYVELPEGISVGFEIPLNQAKFTDKYWIDKHPTALAIYKIHGLNPDTYVSKQRIK